MLAVLYLLGTFVANLFTSRRRLEVENLFFRHQLNIALRRTPHRLRLRGSDRALLVWMTWLWPSLLGLSHIVQPATILRWPPCGRDRGNRSLRGSNPDIRVPVCVSRRGPRSTTATLVCSDPAPDGRVAGATDRGGISMGHGAGLLGARQ
jgi:hypothetical protein